MGIVGIDTGNRDGLYHILGVAYLDDAPEFARAFLDPERCGIAPYAVDSLAAYEFPFAVVASDGNAHDIRCGGSAQVDTAICVGAAVGDADGYFFPAVRRFCLHVHAATAGRTALPWALVVARRYVHMDCRVILDVGLPVIAGPAEARFFFRDAPVGGDGAFAAVVGEFGVCRGIAVAVGTLAIVG